MHFHLPKPLHGWREFIGEVGIIVVGVLIALGAEQLVEDWQWKQRSADGLRAVRRELAQNYVFAAEIATTAPCVDQQLAVLEDRVARSGATLTPSPNYSEVGYARYVYRAPSREWPDVVWLSLADEGITSHIDQGLRQRIDLAYDYLRKDRTRNAELDQLEYRLQLLALPLPLDPSSRNHLIKEIEQSRGDLDDMRLRAQQAMSAIRESGLTPSQYVVNTYLAGSGTVAFCRAHRLPMASVKPLDQG